MGEPLFEERDAGAPELPCVEVGVWVKVGALSTRADVRGERFWCVVTEVHADGALSARIDNDLVQSAHRCGDTVVIGRCHVLETASEDDRQTVRSLAAVYGPRNGALAWPWAYLRREVGVSVQPKRNTLYAAPSCEQ